MKTGSGGEDGVQRRIDESNEKLATILVELRRLNANLERMASALGVAHADVQG
jgi:hypothetical protein